MDNFIIRDCHLYNYVSLISDDHFFADIQYDSGNWVIKNAIFHNTTLYEYYYLFNLVPF